MTETAALPPYRANGPLVEQLRGNFDGTTRWELYGACTDGPDGSADDYAVAIADALCAFARAGERRRYSQQASLSALIDECAQFSPA